MRRIAAIAAASVALVVVPNAAASKADTPTVTTVLSGRSERGRVIYATSYCQPDATTSVLAIGAIHGNETAGLPVIRRLSQNQPPPRTCWWLVDSVNPDGVANRTRQNARGVDLNRNFPFGWRGGGRAFDTYFPGRARASERETGVARWMVRTIRPDLTIWYHQHLTMVIRPPLPWRQALGRTYARESRLMMRSYPGGRLFGTAAAWQHAEQPRSAALVVELPAGALDAASIRRHVAAVRAVSIAARDDAVNPAR